MKIVAAILYVRKMTLDDNVVSAIENNLLTCPASYPYLETLTKTFLVLLVFAVGNKNTFLPGN